MIPMTRPLAAPRSPNVLTIRTVATTRSVPFYPTRYTVNVSMPVPVRLAAPMPTVSPITTTWLASVMKDFLGTPTTCRPVANRNLAAVAAKIVPQVPCVKSTFLAKRLV